MWDTIYIYIGYLYFLKQIIEAIIQAIFPEMNSATCEMWSSVGLIAFMHLHYLIVWWVNDSSDGVSIIVINLASIFIVNIMSFITVFGNSDAIQEGHIKRYALSMVGVNLSWIWAWGFIILPQGHQFFRIGEGSHVVNGVIQDDRDVDNDTIDKINLVFYQPYYKFRNKWWSICIVDYELDDVISVLPICHHTFHKEWISEWLKRNSTCPHWRRKITIGDVESEKDQDIDKILSFVRKTTIGQDMRGEFV